MNTQQISFRELATLPAGVYPPAGFRAVLSVIPQAGCRLFVHFENKPCMHVVDDAGTPLLLPLEFALNELAKLPGINQQVTVDIISLLPRAMTRTRLMQGGEKFAASLIGHSAPSIAREPAHD